MDELLRNANANTIVYIVNALNGEIKTANTLATAAGIIAEQAADGVDQLIITIGEISTDYVSQLQYNEAVARISFQETQTAQLIDQNGNLVGQLALMVNQSELTQTANSITAYFTQQITDVNTALSGTDADVQEVRSWIQESADGILIGKSNSPVKMRITNSQIQIIENNNVITYWSNQAQLTPQALTIPQGGNFTLGSFRFVPRSSGNLSLVKV